jgi:hypothetical protein
MTTPIEDKEAIRELLSEYCFRMDDCRFAELGALFTEDGDWIAPYARARGPAEIAALMARNIPAEPKRKHFIMNSLIRLDGDRASAHQLPGRPPGHRGRAGAVGRRHLRGRVGAYDRRLALP